MFISKTMHIFSPINSWISWVGEFSVLYKTDVMNIRTSCGLYIINITPVLLCVIMDTCEEEMSIRY